MEHRDIAAKKNSRQKTEHTHLNKTKKANELSSLQQTFVYRWGYRIKFQLQTQQFPSVLCSLPSCFPCVRSFSFPVLFLISFLGAAHHSSRHQGCGNFSARRFGSLLQTLGLASSQRPASSGFTLSASVPSAQEKGRRQNPITFTLCPSKRLTA
jgi:hypothetical protein